MTKEHDPDATLPAGPGDDGPPPWINPEIQQRMEWRDGDIAISVPIKSGTTWTMNIVHQLRSGGDAALEDVYAEVPWIEFVPGPSATVDELVARLDAMPKDTRRAFKSHSAPAVLPYHAPGSGKDVKYIVVLRNPEEAIVSLFPFIGNHADEWFDHWKIPRAALVKPDFASFFDDVAYPGFVAMILEFFSSWWPHRDKSNVLFLHFTDMKKDHEGSVRKIADFIGFEPTPDQWPAILEYTSFSWMKAHQEKFEAHSASEVPILKSGAMVRKGLVGAAKDDGMTEEVAGRIRNLAKAIVRDDTALEWLYGGGALPE